LVLRELPTDLVSHGVDELVDVSLQEVVEAGHAPELVVLADNLLAVLHSALSNTAVQKTSFHNTKIKNERAEKIRSFKRLRIRDV
jgi:hypothetical protein